MKLFGQQETGQELETRDQKTCTFRKINNLESRRPRTFHKVALNLVLEKLVLFVKGASGFLQGFFRISSR
ncbi:hypothetical protein M0802_009544 [Mischocyttarus mexicanus]|nr:hypothetical protein M0802_009544 [Mischocyttarus mexicanus]